MTHRKRYIRRLAEAFVLNLRSERHLAMFSAYLDESGKGNERRSFIAVGGLVSSSLQWDRLQREWDERLLHVPAMPRDEQGRPAPFHMNKFEAGNWPTAGYRFRSAMSKRRLLDDLLAIMRHRVKLRVFTVVWLDHYRTLFSGDRRFKIPWVFGTLGCATRIAHWAKNHSPDPVPFIFEQGGEGWGIAYENYCGLKKEGKLGKTRMGSWTFDDKHIAGLQAADLWAWELRNHFQAQVPERQPYSLRPSLLKIIDGVPDGLGFSIGGLELQTLMEDLERGTKRVPAIPFRRNSLPMVIPEAL